MKKIAIRAVLLAAGFLVAAAPAFADVNTEVVMGYSAPGGTDFGVNVVFFDPAVPVPEDTEFLHIPVASTTSWASTEAASQQVINNYIAQDTSFTITNLVDLTNPPTPWTFNYPTLAVNTSRQASATRNALVSASVDVTANLSLVTGQSGKVSLQYADDTGFTTNVKTAQSATNGNTGSLTIGLNLGQVVTATVTGDIPAGKYYRVVTTNITGTPTYGTPAIQEVLQ